jgi:mRNA interferase MazF
VRGDIYELKAPRGTRGDEQRSNRYAVVQSDLLPLTTCLVAPTSTSAPTSQLPPRDRGRRQDHLVLVEQAAAVDPERLGHLVGHLTPRQMSTVDAALQVVLGSP